MSTTSILPLTPRVQRIMVEADKIARAAGHEYVGTEHLLLAIIEVGGGVATHVLDELGQTDAVRQKVREIMESDAYKTPGQ